MSERAPTMASRRAELLEDVMAKVHATLRELGIDDERAAHCGHAVADMLVDDWRGQVICYPVDSAFRLSCREREILQLLDNGSTKAELVVRFGISLNGLNKLIKRARCRHAEDAQRDLFADHAEPV